MASAARTLMPYHGWGRDNSSGAMQADLLMEAVADIAELNLRSMDFGFPEFRIDERINRQEFDENYQQWLQDSEFDSLPEHMRAHHSFQAMVALGDRAIPVIAAELRKHPSFLFLALEDITGEDPVPDLAHGDLLETVDAWLAWLRR